MFVRTKKNKRMITYTYKVYPITKELQNEKEFSIISPLFQRLSGRFFRFIYFVCCCFRLFFCLKHDAIIVRILFHAILQKLRLINTTFHKVASVFVPARVDALLPCLHSDKREREREREKLSFKSVRRNNILKGRAGKGDERKGRNETKGRCIN